ncbi:MAG: hypothetical protein H0W84_00350, partial [Bacteroidetes bacterium]|nr:hypothetical protein [Bacteroidota bacterium]
IFIATYCKSNNIQWAGIDSNQYFVKYAKNKNFNASCGDISGISELPKADVCLIIGSLYHFHTDIHQLLSGMLKSCNIIIISEPVKNLSDQNNWIGRIAKRSANAGKGNEQFRYNETSLQNMLKEESEKLNFNFKIIDFYKKDSIITIEKNGTN